MQIHCTDENKLCMKEKDMKKIGLIIEQIKSAYPSAKTYHDVPNKKITLTLTLQPFGEVIFNENYDILIKYSNPYSIKFEIFKSFFERRLELEGYTPYIYENKIVLYKRVIKESNDFECAIIRANSFIETVKSIEKFIEWNKTLTQNL